MTEKFKTAKTIHFLWIKLVSENHFSHKEKLEDDKEN